MRLRQSIPDTDMHRRHLLTAALCTATMTASFPVLAQTGWPTQTVKIIVPTGPGSSLDLIARTMSDKL